MNNRRVSHLRLAAQRLLEICEDSNYSLVTRIAYSDAERRGLPYRHCRSAK